MTSKRVIAKVIETTNQKRVSIPKQDETKDWKKGDLIELKKVQIKDA